MQNDKENIKISQEKCIKFKMKLCFSPLFSSCGLCRLGMRKIPSQA